MEDTTLYRYFNNEATSDEVSRIEEWLEADPRHREEFDAAHMLFNVAVLHGMSRPSGKFRGVSPWRAVGRIVIRVAAVVALVAGAGYAGGVLEKSRIYRNATTRMNVLEVPPGQRISLLLEDGTKVFLNGGSRMEYPLMFGTQGRRVRLSGEALFEVEHDSARPFTVETFASNIEVLGTKFNVSADDDTGYFSAMLVEGSIRATNLAGDRREEVELKPGETVRLVDGRLETFRDAAPDDVLCWVDGYVRVGDLPFDCLMRRFENAYGVRIVIDRPTLPRIGYAGGKIRISEGVDFALRLLQRASDFTYTKNETGDTITIR